MQTVLGTLHNSEQPDQLFAFTQGINLDKRLARQEIRVQKAWVKALQSINLFTANEAVDVTLALDEALQMMQTGKFPWRLQDEDIHMNLERFITDRLGILGKKMHLGRSRNDLIATSLRLYAHDALEVVQEQLTHLIRTIATRAEKDIDVIIPGMTHLQHGQPIRYSHILMAHAWGFWRDYERLNLAKAHAMAALPLGAAALAGTTLPVDLATIATELGFAAPTVNSYDSVGDRDFMLEGLDAISSVALHLSRIAEDITLWASTGLGLVKLPRAWSTGSSIMPNKRNPDVAELTRAKAARIIGFSMSSRTLMKGLPSSYSSDLHELKGVFMQGYEELVGCLNIMPPLLAELKPSLRHANELLKSGHILATDIADHLTVKGIPFREAYKQVAALVEAAETGDCQITELTADVVAAVAPSLDYAFLKALTPLSAVEHRTASGGTAKARVLEGIAQMRAAVTNVAGVATNGNGAHFSASAVGGLPSARLWELSEWA